MHIPAVKVMDGQTDRGDYNIPFVFLKKNVWITRMRSRWGTIANLHAKILTPTPPPTPANLQYDPGGRYSF